jgi:hypothetical protein
VVSTALLLAGCMSLSPPPQTTWRPPDSSAPLGAQDEYETRRVPSIDSGSPTSPTSPSTQPPDNSPAQPIRPGKTPDPSRGALPKVPRAEPDDVTVGRKITLQVAAPSRKQVGSFATYKVTVRNSGDQEEEDLSVHCCFEEPLFFPGKDDGDVWQKIDRLLPGETKDLSVSLRCNEVGSHCCQFAVTAGEKNTELASRSVCIEFVSRTLDLALVGPTQRTEGSRAEFTITLSNRSVKTLTDVRAVVSHDQALAPVAPADGEPGAPSLVWEFAELRPLENVALTVEFDCRTADRRACVGLEVKSAEGLDEQHEACLEIVPVTGTLDLRVADKTDPLVVGKTGRFEVTIQNIGLQPARQVTLALEPPPQVKVLSIVVHEGENPLPLKYSEEDGKLTFDAVDQLAPNARLTFAIEVEALHPGVAELRARLTSALGTTAVTAAEPTVITNP